MPWQFPVMSLILLVSVSCPVDAGTEQFQAPATIDVPGGWFITGSDSAEREIGYRLDEAAYGHSRTRQNRWYDREIQRKSMILPPYAITVTPVTNLQYREFVVATDHPVPDVGVEEWAGYRLVHPYSRTRRHAWRDGVIPQGRDDHPVVLVSFGDAQAYASWLSEQTGDHWHLPSEAEWEKAARSEDGRYFPWGTDFDPSRLNSHDSGPFDTTDVMRYPAGASPYGSMDMAGNVFEWTRTSAEPGRHIVKGGSWDDSGCGVCRAAARHSRPDHIKHILIGFRLVRDPGE